MKNYSNSFVFYNPRKMSIPYGLVILLIVFVSNVSFAQDSSFPLNEKGKIFYQEEVLVEGVSQEALRLNSINYIASLNQAGQRKPANARLEDGGLVKEASFFVYSKGLITSQVHGEIQFKVKLEVKEEGYLYTFSDFVFQFYQKNRYGQFVPVNGKYKPLEEQRYAGKQDLWEAHKALTRDVVDNHINVLKSKMKEIPLGAKIYDEGGNLELN